MEKTLFEQFGVTYSQRGDYLLPDIVPPQQKIGEIGVWGNRRRRYLREYHKVIYYSMLTEGSLYQHLADVEQQANKMFEQLVDGLSAKEGVTEKLKAENMMLWVRKMNGIRNQAMEIVNNDLIYA